MFNQRHVYKFILIALIPICSRFLHLPFKFGQAREVPIDRCN